MYSILKNGRDKFAPQVIPAVVIGYPFTVKCYKRYNLKTTSVLIFCADLFHEPLSPFHGVSTEHEFIDPFPEVFLPIIPSTDHEFIDVPTTDSAPIKSTSATLPYMFVVACAHFNHLPICITI